jgi:DNA-binding transcriptional LysR family regulator
VTVQVYDNSAPKSPAMSPRARSSSASRCSPRIAGISRSTLLAREPFVLVCRADHVSRRGRPPAGPSWRACALIRISQQTGNRMMIDDALGSRREQLSWRYEVQHVATAIALVRAGLGMTVVPASPSTHARPRRPHVMRLRNPGVSARIGIVSRRAAPPLAEELRCYVVEFSPNAADGDEEGGRVAHT